MNEGSSMNDIMKFCQHHGQQTIVFKLSDEIRALLKVELKLKLYTHILSLNI